MGQCTRNGRPSLARACEESKIMNNEPDHPDDAVTFGPAKERLRFRRLPRAIDAPAARPRRTDARQPVSNGLLVAAAIIIAALTAAVITQAVELSGRPTRVTPATGIHQINDGAIADFPLNGTKGAIVQAQYLRADHGPGFIWLTLATAGLPRGWIYMASVGDCVRGRPRTLTSYSSIPDSQTGIWLESWAVPGTPGTIHWVTVTRTGKHPRPLGGIRGNFVYFGRLVAIPPGHPVCS
jgi:hypothetical protein